MKYEQPLEQKPYVRGSSTTDTGSRDCLSSVQGSQSDRASDGSWDNKKSASLSELEPHWLSLVNLEMGIAIQEL